MLNLLSGIISFPVVPQRLCPRLEMVDLSRNRLSTTEVYLGVSSLLRTFPVHSTVLLLLTYCLCTCQHSGHSKGPPHHPVFDDDDCFYIALLSTALLSTLEQTHCTFVTHISK